MDLPKGFHCIPHDLFVAKPHVYGLTIDAVAIVYSYLKIQKQGVKYGYMPIMLHLLGTSPPRKVWKSNED